MIYDTDMPLCPHYDSGCSLGGKCRSIFPIEGGKYIVNEHGVEICKTRKRAEKIVSTARDMVANPAALEALLTQLNQAT